MIAVATIWGQRLFHSKLLTVWQLLQGSGVWLRDFMVSECFIFIHYRRADKMLEIVSDDKTPLRKHKLAYGKCYRPFQSALLMCCLPGWSTLWAALPRWVLCSFMSTAMLMISIHVYVVCVTIARDDYPVHYAGSDGDETKPPWVVHFTIQLFPHLPAKEHLCMFVNSKMSSNPPLCSSWQQVYSIEQTTGSPSFWSSR